ncbi:hypothetical protein ACWOAH_02145 [Vagococcus vulneris]|uniref:DUF308 domain-containing protein n=1 Tax=Vagococcus vulneris TaxID=1977869 RepID=A0A430A176_9ENTE|nr:hypothetical protein [Vagococcus vulneris]RSU00133.1 hypothetical protein CBF37_02205 [Vagococcus vulneris]
MRKQFYRILMGFDRLNWTLYLLNIGMLLFSILTFMNFDKTLKDLTVAIGMLAIFKGFLSFIFFYTIQSILNVHEIKYLYSIHAFLSIILGISIIYNIFSNSLLGMFLIILWLIIDAIVQLIIVFITAHFDRKKNYAEKILSCLSLLLAIMIGIPFITSFIPIAILVGMYVLSSNMILLLTYTIPTIKHRKTLLK